MNFRCAASKVVVVVHSLVECTVCLVCWAPHTVSQQPAVDLHPIIVGANGICTHAPSVSKHQWRKRRAQTWKAVAARSAWRPHYPWEPASVAYIQPSGVNPNRQEKGCTHISNKPPQKARSAPRQRPCPLHHQFRSRKMEQAEEVQTGRW